MTQLKEILINSVNKIITDSSVSKNISKIALKNSIKPHFIPLKYRVFSGLLQSMNIKFGNFLEVAISDILKLNPDNEILHISGLKQKAFRLSKVADDLVNRYMTDATTNYTDITIKQTYGTLIKKLHFCNQDVTNLVNIKHDVDLLFKNRKTGITYYVEIKYNDDHDTGKYEAINSKVLKTYSCLARDLNIQDINKFKPILYYFSNKKLKGNIFLPEGEVIYRGAKLFEEFATIKYIDFEQMLTNFSTDQDTIKQFDDLYNRVMSNQNDMGVI